jgi:hypothetical protein
VRQELEDIPPRYFLQQIYIIELIR